MRIRFLSRRSLADARSQLQAIWELVEGNADLEALEEMVNVLQIVLSVEGPAVLSPGQLDAISSVVAKMEDDPDLSDQTANDLTRESSGAASMSFARLDNATL